MNTDMYKPYKMVRDAVRKFPLPLLEIKDPKVRAYADSLLPTTVGMEISIHCLSDSLLYKHLVEARQKGLFYDVNLYEYTEPKICLNKGIKGFVELWELSKILKQYGQLNPDAGIHYHVAHDFVIRERHTLHRKILSALDTWGYKGNYNKRDTNFHGKSSCWVNLNRTCGSSITAEFRIGEMTFEYKLLVKRILHCVNIVSSLKSSPVKRETKLPEVSPW